MIYILNIGYESYAFKNSRGLQTVMDAMSKAVRLKHHYYPGCEKESPERLDLADGNVEVSMSVVNGVSFVSGKTKRTVIEPEVMPRQRGCEPDATETALALNMIRREKLSGEFRRLIGGRE